jgi:NADH-quinone oxidoreductase subunit H
MNEALVYTLIVIVKIAVVFGLLLGSVPPLVLLERKLLGWIQMRPGPNRVGPWGVLQTVVDGAKLLFKEDVIPAGVDKVVYQLAPILVMAIALIVPCVIPFGPEIEIGGYTIALSIADLDLGLVFVFAISSLSVYGVVLAGWSSDNKWSLLGGLRSSAQMISYELALALSVIGVLLLAGTFSLREIVEQQEGGFWHWNILRQPLGFVLLLLAGTAETNRVPFDLPEGESELTGGYHTEYSSMRFAFFFMGEYVSVFFMSALIATLFLGGFHAPFPYEYGRTWLDGLFGVFWLLAKVGAFVVFFIWMRGTLPRLRYDQLMALGWKIALPLAFLNLFVTAGLLVLETKWSVMGEWWVMLLVGVILLFLIDLSLSRIFWRRRRAAR